MSEPGWKATLPFRDYENDWWKFGAERTWPEPYNLPPQRVVFALTCEELGHRLNRSAGRQPFRTAADMEALVTRDLMVTRDTPRTPDPLEQWRNRRRSALRNLLRYYYNRAAKAEVEVPESVLDAVLDDVRQT